jgi:type I restriction enzyme S subunit
MGTSFPTQTLGEVVEFKNGKSIKPGGEGEYPVYGSNGVIGAVDEPREENGIILGRVGAYCGSVAYERGKFWASDNTIVAYPKESSHHVRFLAYLLGHLDLHRWAGGAAQPLLTQTVLRQIEAPVPPYPTQRKIAAILSAYDDLIENNLRRIKILEEMAQALYREWFVQFRFPGHEKVRMVDSPVGGIPEGWQVCTFEEVSLNFDRIRRPLSKMQRETRKGAYPYYGAAKVFDYIDDYIFDGVYLLIAEDGSVITPDRRPVLQYASGRFWANNHTHIIQGKSPVSTEFLYFMLKDFDISGYITGAAQPKITQANLNRIPILVSDQETLKKFDAIVADVQQEIILLQKKKENLRFTRDLLLPKLISGELDVSELDIKVPEEAV